MIHIKRLIEETRESSSPTKNKRESSFAYAFPDPLGKLNLKETSEFAKALPMATKNSSSSSSKRREGRMETASTPGRPLFSFSAGNLSRKSVPSKWDDAEKWVISSSCHESPAHATKSPDPSRVSRQSFCLHQNGEPFAEKLKDAEEKVARFHGVPTEVVLKDKFTDNMYAPCTKSQFSDQTREGFFFRGSYFEPIEDASTEVIGTEITPLGSSSATRCPALINSSSPARHNTPQMSGPLVARKATLNISELKDCHFAKLQLSAQYDSAVPNWSSREEEEEEVSKSLRHFEIGGQRKGLAESRACLWEEEERTKSCTRYQREEAKIQAWLNLQHAKAEEQSRKLEVKIQKMRSSLEEKLMKRMALVHSRAEEARAAAQLQHTQENLRASAYAHKMRSQCHSRASCGCFPCSNNL